MTKKKKPNGDKTLSRTPKKETMRRYQTLAREYTKGASVAEIAKAHNICRDVVGRALKCTGTLSRLTVQKHEKDVMVRAYLEGMSAKVAGVQCGRGASTVRRELEKRKIPTRILSSANRRYEVNEHFFDDIDTEEKAYWLGFIAADGCVHNSYLIISLQRRDENHLRLFLKALDSNYRVIRYSRINKNLHTNKKRKVFHYSRITLCSPTLIGALRKHGIIERKTHGLKPPHIHDNYMRHFFRGVFDGDGCISSYKPRKTNPTKAWRLSLTGSRGMVASFAAFIRNITPTKAKMRKRKNSHEFTVSGVQTIYLVIEKLYGNSIVALQRKKKAAKKAWWDIITPRNLHANIRKLSNVT